MFSHKRRLPLIKDLLLIFTLTAPVTANATIVEMETNKGNIFIQLFDTIAPKTVANFLTYVNSGAYNNSFFHRSVSKFIIQGGGYTLGTNDQPVTIPTNAPVVNEFGKSNLAGTIAMAKLSNSPDSATDEWFFNLANNSTNLDHQNGGFTVFGQVIGNSMQVIKAIAALKVVNACGSSSCDFSNLPMVTTGQGYNNKTLVMVNKVSVISLQAFTDEKTVPLTSISTVFTPPSIGVVHGITLTNTQPNAVNVTLIKNATTLMMVSVQANSTLNIPWQSGMAFTAADSFKIDLPSGPDYTSNPLYLMFDAQ
jgi:cyclophilin family peptidyl-prolyl cis-trans isomerase